MRARVATPAGLWLALHGRHPPAGATWGALVGALNLSDVARPAAGASPGLVTWNVRWLASPHTDQGQAKRLAILAHLRRGTIVCLQ